MVPLPFVVHAQYHRAFQIRLTFNDGTQATVDFEDWLKGPVFEPIRDEDYFRRFFIDAGAISWPNGADIAPKTLYKRARAGAAA